MPKCFCNSPGNSKDFGNVKVAPLDSGARRVDRFLKRWLWPERVPPYPGVNCLGKLHQESGRVVPGRIDVHHHMFPPFYVKAMEDEMKADGFTPRPWTPATSLDMMDKAGVATAMLSPVQRLVMDSMRRTK